MRRFSVKSMNLAEVGYDPLTTTMEVVFCADRRWVYTYKHVGMIKFVKLITAPSIGQYFDKHIRAKPKMHPYTKRKE
jgi:hypothetical protein